MRDPLLLVRLLQLVTTAIGALLPASDRDWLRGMVRESEEIDVPAVRAQWLIGGIRGVGMRVLLNALGGVVLASAASTAVVAIHLAVSSSEDFGILEVGSFALLIGISGTILSALVFVPCLAGALSRSSPSRVRILAPLTAALLICFGAVAIKSVVPRIERVLLSELVIVAAALMVFAFVFVLDLARAASDRPRSLGRALVCLGLIGASTWLIPRVQTHALADQRNGDLLSVPLLSARSGHSATLLGDGRVLLSGGMVELLGDEKLTNSTEIFEPLTGRTVAGPAMQLARGGHAATLLPTGDVLVTGGLTPDGVTATAEIYVSREGRFRSCASMALPRERHSSTLLHDGRILVAGGTMTAPSDRTELFQPHSGAFSPGPTLSTRRAAHSASLLEDGRVLIGGGSTRPGEVTKALEYFDPIANVVTRAGELAIGRHKHAAVTMPGGGVLFLAGSDGHDWSGRLASVERFDPVSGRAKHEAPLVRQRFKVGQAVVVTPTGTVVVGGGDSRIELWRTTAPAAPLTVKDLGDSWHYATATLLNDGRVLIAGGYNQRMIASREAWIFEERVIQ